MFKNQYIWNHTLEFLGEIFGRIQLVSFFLSFCSEIEKANQNIFFFSGYLDAIFFIFVAIKMREKEGEN